MTEKRVSIGMARAVMGVAFIIGGLIVALWIPVLDIQANSVPFTLYLSFAVGFITSGMVLVVEGGLDHLAHHSSD